MDIQGGWKVTRCGGGCLLGEQGMGMSTENVKWFLVKEDLRQRCVISPQMLHLFLERLVKDVNVRVLDHGPGAQLVNQLLFEDDSSSARLRQMLTKPQFKASQ